MSGVRCAVFGVRVLGHRVIGALGRRTPNHPVALSPCRPVALACLLALPLLAGCGKGATQARHDPARAESRPALFRDVSTEAGIRFTLGHGGRSPLTILETLGNGAAFFDFDNDGWLDILLVGPNKIALYRNRGLGFRVQDSSRPPTSDTRPPLFEDVTAQSGLRAEGYWQGVATGDYDNDGRMDVFVTGYRCCALYRNRGVEAFRRSGVISPGSPPSQGGEREGVNTRTPERPTPLFEDVTKQAGLKTGLWSASASFVDVDNDGYLDLFVTNYVKFYPHSTKFCLFDGVPSTCGPTTYDPEKPLLYHNKRNGTFADETAKRGLASAHGNALGSAIADYDGDGWIDIAVANDQLPGDLFRNKGGGFFENVGGTSGTAYDAQGNAHAGMGLDWADYDLDGSLELVVTTYQHQPTSLYKQTAPGMFSDICFTAGTAQPTVNYVGFGAKFIDYDNDSLADLVIANGHAVDNIEKVDSMTTYPQPTQLFHNVGGGKLVEVTAEAGPDFTRKIVGRGLAVGDYDNDGDLDLLVVDAEGHPLLLRNEAQTAHHWLSLKLVGRRSNRDGIGARVTVEAGGKTWSRGVATDGSFMSASDVRAHLGLGKTTKVDRITIRWPSGRKTTLKDVDVDRFLTVEE